MMVPSNADDPSPMKLVGEAEAGTIDPASGHYRNGGHRCPVTGEVVYMSGREFDERIGKIYAVLAGPFFKIGWSLDPTKRVEDFKAQPYSPEVIGWTWGRMPDERACHRILRDRGLHQRGEWFHVTPESIRFVAWLLTDRKSGALAGDLKRFAWSEVGA